MKNLIFDESIVDKFINIFYTDIKDPVIIQMDLVHSTLGFIKSYQVEYNYDKGKINLDEFKIGLSEFNNMIKLYSLSELNIYIYPNTVLVNKLTGELQSSLAEFNKRVLRNFRMDKNSISEFIKFMDGRRINGLIPDCLNNRFKVYYIGLPDVDKYRNQYNKKLIEVLSTLLNGVNHFITSIKNGYNLFIEKKNDFFRKVDPATKKFCCKFVPYWDGSVITTKVLAEIIPYYLKINHEDLNITEVNSVILPGSISGNWKVKFI